MLFGSKVSVWLIGKVFGLPLDGLLNGHLEGYLTIATTLFMIAEKLVLV